MIDTVLTFSAMYAWPIKVRNCFWWDNLNAEYFCRVAEWAYSRQLSEEQTSQQILVLSIPLLSACRHLAVLPGRWDHFAGQGPRENLGSSHTDVWITPNSFCSSRSHKEGVRGVLHTIILKHISIIAQRSILNVHSHATAWMNLTWYISLWS